MWSKFLPFLAANGNKRTQTILLSYCIAGNIGGWALNRHYKNISKVKWWAWLLIDFLGAHARAYYTPGEKDRADSWLQCEFLRYLMVSAVTCGLSSIAPSNLLTMSMIEREKNGTMAFQR